MALLEISRRTALVGFGSSIIAVREARGWLGTFQPLTTIFVDQINGNDTRSGDSRAQAFKNIAAGQAVVSPTRKTFFLARTSEWREQLNVTVSGQAVYVYGSGPMPVLNGADIVTTGWTKPDAAGKPNVWSIPWTRAQVASTGEAKLGYWQLGARTTRRADLDALQAGSNGDWHTTSLTGTTVTVSIRAAGDPNTDGILREITKRSHCYNGHPVTAGATYTGQSVNGPLELKKALEHYNALSMGPGTASRVIARDGNIHNSVSAGNLTDVLLTEFSPDSSPSLVAFYNGTAAGFNAVATRVLGLLPGGANRVDQSSAIYNHSGTGKTDSMTLAACMTRGCDHVAADTLLLTADGSYSVDVPYRDFSLNGSLDNVITHGLCRDTTASPFSSSNAAVYHTIGAAQARVSNLCVFKLSGRGYFKTENTYKHFLSNSSFQIATTPIYGGLMDVRNCICIGTARSMDQLPIGYAGDFNVFYWVGLASPVFFLNGVNYGTLAAFQAASGQDANSVYLKAADQVSGNGIAFWLGVATGANSGPPSGDWRVNQNAKAYNGAGTAFTGLFADGVTPITQAGAQEHWDYNLRAVAAGPPTRWPTLPDDTIAQKRAWEEDPAGWNYYP